MIDRSGQYVKLPIIFASVGAVRVDRARRRRAGRHRPLRAAGCELPLPSAGQPRAKSGRRMTPMGSPGRYQHVIGHAIAVFIAHQRRSHGRGRAQLDPGSDRARSLVPSPSRSFGAAGNGAAGSLHRRGALRFVGSCIACRSANPSPSLSAARARHGIVPAPKLGKRSSQGCTMRPSVDTCRAKRLVIKHKFNSKSLRSAPATARPVDQPAAKRRRVYASRAQKWTGSAAVADLRARRQADAAPGALNDVG